MERDLRTLLSVTVLVTLLATAGCNDSDSLGASAPTPETQAAPSPETETTPGTGALTLPDADELVIPTVSERELEASMRRFSGGEVPLITVKGSSIIYRGEIFRDGHDALVVHAERSNISELTITSPGGSAYWGIRIGEVVYENGWDVRVRGLCYSSCANYIFPAGRKKIIEDGGIVGWHGSALRYQFEADRLGISIRQAILNSLPLGIRNGLWLTTQEEANKDAARIVAEHETLIELERAFYERIGVDPDASAYGHFPERWAAFEGSGGWTFTLEDMAKFGLDGIIYEGSDAYPSDQVRALHGLVLIEVDDR